MGLAVGLCGLPFDPLNIIGLLLTSAGLHCLDIVKDSLAIPMIGCNGQD